MTKQWSNSGQKYQNDINPPNDISFDPKSDVESEFIGFESKSGLHGRERPSVDRLTVHVNKGPKFGLGLSISWTDSDAGPRLSF